MCVDWSHTGLNIKKTVPKKVSEVTIQTKRCFCGDVLDLKLAKITGVFSEKMQFQKRLLDMRIKSKKANPTWTTASPLNYFVAPPSQPSVSHPSVNMCIFIYWNFWMLSSLNDHDIFWLISFLDILSFWI